jgi:hypothetical protein
MVAMLTGCTSAKVAETARTAPVGAQPLEILVDVSATPPSEAKRAKVVRDVSSTLQSSLVKELTAAHIAAEVFVPGAPHPGAAVLHVTVTEASPGSTLERFVVGFGVGRAQLNATAELRVGDATGGTLPLNAFNTYSDSGFKPGLLLPGGIALATGDAAHLAIAGGLDVAFNIHGGLQQPLKHTSSAIVKQLKKYYGSVGWSWPDAEQSRRS